MRLIDADKLMENTILLEGYEEDAWLPEKDIETAETVEAVPVVHAHSETKKYKNLINQDVEITVCSNCGMADCGKIIALHNADWGDEQIACEMDVPLQTVRETIGNDD